MTIFSPIQIVQLQSFGQDAPSSPVTFSFTGVKDGDVLISVYSITTGISTPVGSNFATLFSTLATADNELQQNAGSDLSSIEFTFTFLRFNQSA